MCCCYDNCVDMRLKNCVVRYDLRVTRYIMSDLRVIRCIMSDAFNGGFGKKADDFYYHATHKALTVILH